PADSDAVPAAERPHTLLMRKVAYEPAIETTDGNRSKVEVRILFIWKDGQPLPVTTLARLSQGKMMGVSFNKDRTWVGSSGCLWPAGKTAAFYSGHTDTAERAEEILGETGFGES